MKLKVLSYNKACDFHLCIDENGELRRVDVMVDGFFRDRKTQKSIKEPEDLIGMVIHCESVGAYIEIANGVFDCQEG